MSAMLQSPVSADQVRDLLTAYADAIDAGDLKQWPEFFVEPCLYRITTRFNEDMGYPLSIMLCDNKAMLFDRVEAIEQANVFEPHHYRHVLSHSRCVHADADHVRVETSFICVRTMVESGAMMVFAAGKYVDEVVLVAGEPKFRSRTVILDSSQVDTLLAIPL